MDVTREITLPVDPDAAWEAVTDLERWLTDDGSLELEPGAAGELTLRDGETRWATVEDVRVGEHLSFWWHAPDALATLVERRPRRRRRTARASSSSSAATPASRSAARRGRAARARPARAQRRRRDGVAELPDRPRLRAHALDWEPALARLRRAADLVEA